MNLNQLKELAKLRYDNQLLKNQLDALMEQVGQVCSTFEIGRATAWDNITHNRFDDAISELIRAHKLITEEDDGN